MDAGKTIPRVIGMNDTDPSMEDVWIRVYQHIYDNKGEQKPRIGIQLDLLDSERLKEFFRRNGYSIPYAEFGARRLASVGRFKVLGKKIASLGGQAVIVDSEWAVKKARDSLERKLLDEIAKSRERLRNPGHPLSEPQEFYNLLHQGLIHRDFLSANLTRRRNQVIQRTALKLPLVVLETGRAKTFARKAGTKAEMLDPRNPNDVSLAELNLIRFIDTQPELERLGEYRPLWEPWQRFKRQAHRKFRTITKKFRRLRKQGL